MIGSKEFLTNRDETGREMVFYPETGKRYFIEYIEGRNSKVSWGDIDPATKKLTGSYGGKLNGAIKAEDSLITKENGFDEIKYGGGSPYATIQKMHDEWKLNNNY